MKKILLAALTAITAVAVSFSIGVAAKSAQATWDDVTVSKALSVGDEMELPSRNVSVNGDSAAASVKLYYPDGTAINKTSDSAVKLTLAGSYRLVYEAKVNGTRYTDEISFKVSDKLWKVGNSRSSAEYGHDPLAEEGVDGLLVKLASRDTLTFGKVIDLSTLTKSDTLVSGFITPSVQGSYDFDAIVFTFTDVYNPDNYITVRGMRSKDTSLVHQGMSYWNAASAGQLLSGYENGNYHHGDGYGLPYQHSWMAMVSHWGYVPTANPGPSNSGTIEIRLDKAEGKVYIGNTLLTDLDDADLHEGEPIWEGFSSDKVILTVSTETVVGETANFCIKSVLGYDLTSENKFFEYDAPIITVDDADIVDSNGNFAPLALVGASYPVPSATAFDEYSGDLKVTSEVYYNYADETNRTPVRIKNERFNVTNVGAYTVVYTATDHMGNVARTTRGIRAVASLPEALSISLSDGYKTSGICGERFVLADAATFGGSGERTVEITATLGDDTIVITDGTFIPEKAGDWTIKYVVTDITATTAEASYTITAVASDQPVFVYEPALPRFLISGMNHAVPSVYAYDYSDGTTKKVLATLSVTDKNGTKDYQAGAKFVPVVAKGGDEVTLTFKAGETKLVKKIPAVIPVKDSMLEIENLFVGNNFAGSKNDDGLAVTAAADGDSSWIFANPVAADSSSILVHGVNGKDKFDYLEVSFIDSVDANVSVTVKIKNVKTRQAVVEIGDVKRDIAQGFALADNVFDIGYKSGEFYVGKTSVAVKTDDNGAAFDGFKSGKVYISVKMTNAKAGGGYLLKSFDNNAITNLSIDGITPRIAINGDYGGMFDFGDVYVLNSAIASDTVDPDITFNVTVKSPSGKIVKDVNGKELNEVDPSIEYSFKLTESGQYRVTYTAIDSEYNEATTSYGINILDKVAPTIKLGSASTTAKVGETVKLPVISVSDDVTAAENVKVYAVMRTSDGALIPLGAHEMTISGETYKIRYAYTFDYVGEYTFIVLAMDEAGNQALAKFVVTVTA